MRHYLSLLLLVLLNGGCAQEKYKAMRSAIAAGDHQKVAYLLQDNPKLVNYRPEATAQTLLADAAYVGDKMIVALLLTNGADVNAKGIAGSPLHLATLKGHKDVVVLLLNRGADVGAKDDWGLTPLQRAAERGQREIALLLIEQGADVNAAGGKGWDIEKHRESFEGEPIRWTPLHWAVGKHNKEVVKLLLTRGADVTAKDEDGRTPLALAVERNDPAIVQLLKQHQVQTE